MRDTFSLLALPTSLINARPISARSSPSMLPPGGYGIPPDIHPWQFNLFPHLPTMSTSLMSRDTEPSELAGSMLFTHVPLPPLAHMVSPGMSVDQKNDSHIFASTDYDRHTSSRFDAAAHFLQLHLPLALRMPNRTRSRNHLNARTSWLSKRCTNPLERNHTSRRRQLERKTIDNRSIPDIPARRPVSPSRPRAVDRPPHSPAHTPPPSSATRPRLLLTVLLSAKHRPCARSAPLATSSRL